MLVCYDHSDEAWSRAEQFCILVNSKVTPEILAEVVCVSIDEEQEVSACARHLAQRIALKGSKKDNTKEEIAAFKQRLRKDAAFRIWRTVFKGLSPYCTSYSDCNKCKASPTVSTHLMVGALGTLVRHNLESVFVVLENGDQYVVFGSETNGRHLWVDKIGYDPGKGVAYFRAAGARRVAVERSEIVGYWKPKKYLTCRRLHAIPKRELP